MKLLCFNLALVFLLHKINICPSLFELENQVLINHEEVSLSRCIHLDKKWTFNFSSFSYYATSGMMIILILTILFNAIVITGILKKPESYKRGGGNWWWFLLSLSIADMTVGTVVMPFRFKMNILKLKGKGWKIYLTFKYHHLCQIWMDFWNRFLPLLDFHGLCLLLHIHLLSFICSYQQIYSCFWSYELCL